MSFRRAPGFILALIILTPLAFWPSYFSTMRAAPSSLHFHAAAATIWMVLLALQSWSAPRGQVRLHRLAGIASLALFPLFLASLVGVISSMARQSTTNPFYLVNGARLGAFDAVSPLALCWLFNRALALRRNLQLHARYMLAMPVLFLEPIVERLAGHVIPIFVLHGSQDFGRFVWTVLFSEAVTLAVALLLCAAAPRHGRPFLIVGAVGLIQASLFTTLGGTPEWRSIFQAFGDAPLLPILAATALCGALAGWQGWAAGATPHRASPRSAHDRTARDDRRALGR